MICSALVTSHCMNVVQLTGFNFGGSSNSGPLEVCRQDFVIEYTLISFSYNDQLKLLIEKPAHK